ncbi:MAG: DUF4358 domain-containing protein [Eubacteriales bacterium]|nr:DUF4358 domain-containing protein [Eubacteriales bacterium]
MKKRLNITVLLLAAVLGTSVTACSGSAKTAETTAAETGAAVSGKPAAEILSEIYDSVSLPGVMEMPAQYIMNYYGIDTGAYPDSFFAMSEDATSAEMIVFVRAASEAEAAVVGEQLQMIRDTKAEEMQNYLPEQYQLVSGSDVVINGNTAYLVISEQAAAIRSVIESGI